MRFKILEVLALSVLVLSLGISFILCLLFSMEALFHG
ncbi:hypothetical protein HPCU_01020 [Helicobacter pylori Cuz20]|uniref:Uncharacterized protein n=1 Tax=Helicobacter pylori (strain Cuz20) TaxID=765964 RepID=A0AB32X684_HELPC|nr:hypothetical protein HPCU_01020 [Helicobacter pylori Cuz20]